MDIFIIASRLHSKQIYKEKMKKIIHSRKDAQPSGVKTGGSTFKNPIGQKAAAN